MNSFRTRGRKLLAAVATASILAAGCGDSESFVFTNQVNNNIPAVINPLAVNDTATGLGNATLNQSAANGVLTNDTPNGAAITAFDATSTQGGAVNLAADGSFTYTPVFGFTGNDTFTYTLGTGGNASTATVTVNVPNLGFFVNNSVAPGGNGSQADPFNALANAIGAAGSGDTIFVFRGDGTSTNIAGAVNLPTGVKLIGEGSGLVAQTIVPVGTAPQMTGPITCNGDNTISGLNLTGSADDAIVGNTVSNLTITDNVFGTPGANGNQVDLDDVGGTVNITGNTFGTPGANEECVQVETTVNGTYNISGNTFSNDGSQSFEQALEFDSRGAAVVSVVASNNTISGPDNNNSFDEGLDLQSNDTSQLTVTVDGNDITNVEDDAIDTDAEETSTLTVTATNNMITTPGFSGLDVDSFAQPGATIIYSASGNVVTNPGVNGAFLGDFYGTATVTFTNNQISGGTGDGILGVTDSTANATFFVRDNNVSGTGDDSIDFEATGPSTMCVDVTGNTLDDDLVLDNMGGATLNVERFLPGDGGPLDAVGVNSIGGVVQPFGAITSQIAGFCTP